MFSAVPQAMRPVQGIIYRAIDAQLIHKAEYRVKNRQIDAMTLPAKVPHGSIFLTTLRRDWLFFDSTPIGRSICQNPYDSACRPVRPVWPGQIVPGGFADGGGGSRE